MILIVDKLNVQRDPAKWPLHFTDAERHYYIDKGYTFFQNKNSNFKESKREYNQQSRYFSSKYFVKVLKNGEKVERKWVMYSESTGKIFCYFCKLFTNESNSSKMFVKWGFCNWKKIEESLVQHENSQEHKRCTVDFVHFIQVKENIDKSITNSVEKETKYWIEILRRVVAVIRYLSVRGLAFRGSDERFNSPFNGNYLGALELIAEFDPFLRQHIDIYGNKGRGNVSYLTKTIYEEFIILMSDVLLERIKSEMKNAKYWGLIVDSTPDVSHVDQLSVIFRYYFNSHVHERFFCFIPIHSHKGKSMKDELITLFDKHDLLISDCRAQSYDNASNMSGKYEGLQAHIKKDNKLALFVPCIGHSLNLVGECSVDECTCAVTFFSVTQKLYVFFTCSTHRWEVLRTQAAHVQGLSTTRWSRRADAVKDLKQNYKGIYQALIIISQDQSEKREVREEARSLANKLTVFENAFMTVLWHCILSRFESVSKFIQKVEVDLCAANDMLQSLVQFIINLRNEFLRFEKDAAI